MVKLPFVIKFFVLPIFEGPFYTGFYCGLHSQAKHTIGTEATSSRLEYIQPVHKRQYNTRFTVGKIYGYQITDPHTIFLRNISIIVNTNFNL